MNSISDPNCTRGERFGLKCNYVSARSIPFDDTLDSCSSKLDAEDHLSSRDLRVLDWNEIAPDDDVEVFWVGNDLAEFARRMPRNEGGSNDNNTRNKSNCQAWSKRRKAYTSMPCDTPLPFFCQTDLNSKKKGLFKKRKGLVKIAFHFLFSNISLSYQDNA